MLMQIEFILITHLKTNIVYLMNAFYLLLRRGIAR